MRGLSDEKKVSCVRILFLKPAERSAKILCSSADGNHARRRRSSLTRKESFGCRRFEVEGTGDGAFAGDPNSTASTPACGNGRSVGRSMSLEAMHIAVLGVLQEVDGCDAVGAGDPVSRVASGPKKNLR